MPVELTWAGPGNEPAQETNASMPRFMAHSAHNCRQDRPVPDAVFL